jgi:rSAM/selenodomain-associated transferase 1
MMRHLIVFAKTPHPGRVKTRLTPHVSPDEAAALARAFLQDVLAMGESLPDCDLTLAYTPRGTRPEMRGMAGSRWRLRLQRGRDLGERLSDAFASHLLRGADRVVIIGSDSPLLTADRVREAFEALDRADLVIGPCDDGGYYLLGLRRWPRGLLQDIRWSTDQACPDTLAQAARLGLKSAVLGGEYDVDDVGGLARLINDLRALPASRAPCARAELMRQGRWDR